MMIEYQATNPTLVQMLSYPYPRCPAVNGAGVQCQRREGHSGAHEAHVDGLSWLWPAGR